MESVTSNTFPHYSLVNILRMHFVAHKHTVKEMSPASKAVTAQRSNKRMTLLWWNGISKTSPLPEEPLTHPLWKAEARTTDTDHLRLFMKAAVPHCVLWKLSDIDFFFPCFMNVVRIMLVSSLALQSGPLHDACSIKACSRLRTVSLKHLQAFLKGSFHATMLLRLTKFQSFGFSPVNFIFNNFPTTLSIRIVSHGEDWKTMIKHSSFVAAQPHKSFFVGT